MTKDPKVAPSATPITEAKKAPSNPRHVPLAPYGVTDAQGHVMKRIQQAKPALWAKIQNWD